MLYLDLYKIQTFNVLQGFTSSYEQDYFLARYTDMQPFSIGTFGHAESHHAALILHFHYQFKHIKSRLQYRPSLKSDQSAPGRPHSRLRLHLMNFIIIQE